MYAILHIVIAGNEMADKSADIESKTSLHPKSPTYR